MPMTDNVEPILEQLRRETAEPMCKKSKTDTDDPIREIDLTASAAPIIAKSRTDREKTEPSRLKPSKETEDPQRE
jgi:hypothetical protein